MRSKTLPFLKKKIFTPIFSNFLSNNSCISINILLAHSKTHPFLKKVINPNEVLIIQINSLQFFLGPSEQFVHFCEHPIHTYSKTPCFLKKKNILSNPSNNSYISINILLARSKTHPFFKKVIQTRFLLLFKPILSNFFSNNSHISINILLARSKRFYFFKKVIQTRFLLSNSL